MKRTVDHTRHEGETMEQYNKRLEAETLAYKSTLDYRLWDMRNTMSEMVRYARNEDIRKWCCDVLDRLNCLSCTDFGENTDGTLVKEMR